MAQEKIMNHAALTYYDSKLKAWVTAADAKVLKDAKDYADSLAPNYDASGVAKTLVDALANGAVKSNTDAIAAINNETTGILAQAKSYADGKDAAIAEAKKAGTDAQGAVEDLAEYVGTLPDGTSAKSVVEYVNVKTAGIATDAALSDLQGQVSAAQQAIDAIEEDYLKGADKTELQGKIDKNAEDIKAVADDYLKGADKTEIEGKIVLKADQSALEAEVQRATAAEEGLQTQINTIMNNPDAEGAINSINEFAQYVKDHGSIADGMRVDINKNKDDIAAEIQRATGVENGLIGRLSTLEAIDHNAYVAADTALKTELNGEIAKKADQSVVDAMDAAYKAADKTLGERLDAVEGALGTGAGSVEEKIATAKAEAIADAAAKDVQVLKDAKAYTDEKVGAIDLSGIGVNAGEISTLKGKVSTLETDVAGLKTAVTETLPASIAEAKKAGTDAQAEVDALEGVVETLSGTVGGHTTSLSSHGDRLTALESKVGDGFVAITNSEIDALFA